MQLIVKTVSAVGVTPIRWRYLNMGLGILAKSFYDHGLINRVLIRHHPHLAEHLDWYPEDVRFEKEQLFDFLKGLDILLMFENPFFPYVLLEAARMGIKTVLIPMYECTPELPCKPNLVICPSLLDLDYFKHKHKSVFLPIPVEVKWRLRERAVDFVHNAGHGGCKYRNGTPELIYAMQLVKTPVRLLLRVQNDDNKERLVDQWPKLSPNIDLFEGVEDADKLWDYGDVFIFPEKFNGLSLPLQEAYAAGMLVMAGNRYPMNTWLPTEPLIPVDRYIEDRICVSFRSAKYKVQSIAQTIDAWYGKDISKYSERGRIWAQEHSWEVLRPQYIEILGS